MAAAAAAGVTSVLNALYWVRAPAGETGAALAKRMKWDADLLLRPRAFKPVAPIDVMVTGDKPDWVGLPRFYGVAKLGPPSKDARKLGREAPDVPPVKLRDYQQPAVAATLAQLQDIGGAILNAQCGSGKTVMSLAVAQALKRRTFVLCPTVVLVDQWVERARAFLPGWSVGRLQGQRGGKTWDVDKDIVVCSLASLARCEQPQEVLDTAGLVIVDEAHHMAARDLSRVMETLPARYVLGLSATLDRADGLRRLVEWLCGPVAVVVDNVRSVERKTVLEVRVPWRGEPVPMRDGRMDYVAALRRLERDDARNASIVEAVRVLKERGCVHILVLAAFISHTRAIGANLTGLAVEVVKSEGGARAKEESLKAALAADVVVATYSKLGEGYDNDRIDGLVMAAPRKTVEQCVGRAVRSSAGKTQCVVVDLVDDAFQFAGMTRARKAFYGKHGFAVEACDLEPRAAWVRLESAGETEDVEMPEV